MLRTKLTGSFLVIILITGIVATGVGIHIIDRGIVREAQNKVELDLNSARQIYEQTLQDIRMNVVFTAKRTFAVQRALQEQNMKLLQEALKESRDLGGLDVMGIAGPDGRVILRVSNPDVSGDDQSHDDLIRNVLVLHKPCACTQIVTREDLLKESETLADRARMDIRSTPKAKPAHETVNTSGMMLRAAAPVYDEGKKLIGILYGGVLLNRNYAIVDTVKGTVYRGVKYEGKDIGTATIFQNGLRISTNVTNKNGTRAVGTMVSGEVFDRVIDEGKTWTGRAFVVNDWYITAYEPIRSISGEIIGILYVGILEKKYSDIKVITLLTFLCITGVGMLFAFGIAYFIAHTVTRPVMQLKTGVERLSKGCYDCGISVRTKDEIGRLADSFNMLCRELQKTHTRLRGKIEAADEDLKKAYRELQQKQDRLVEAEKLASMGQLSAGIAHEINNPLGTILLHAHILLRKLKSDEEIREDISLIMEESERCRHIVRGLLDFGRQTHVAAVSSDIGELIDDALVLIDSEEKAHDVEFAKHIEQGMPHIPVDSNQIKQVLINLLKNSLEAVDGIEGRITCEAGMSENKRSAVIRVADNGRGISKENLSQIFTPFFTTKESEKGTGLGLAIAYGIIKMHSGSITAESEEGKGTVFTVSLPVQGAKTKETEGRNVSPEVKEIHF